jgi:hypothetical protein
VNNGAEEELSIYEKNLRLLELYSPIIYRDYMRFSGMSAERPHESAAEIEVLAGRRGYPTFRLTAPVVCECGGGPLVFSNREYRNALRAVFDEIDAAAGGGERVRFDRSAGPRLMPDFRTRFVEHKVIHGHSLFDPARDAEKRFAGKEFGERDRVVLIGFGFGYEVRELLKKYKHPTLIVLEPYVSVFRKALETVDLSDIIMSRRVLVSFSLDPGDLQYTLLAGTSYLNLPGFKLYSLPHAAAFPQFIRIIGKTRHELAMHLTFNMATGMIAGPAFQNNLAFNFISAMKNPGIGMLGGKFKGKPVFVVAPGPSLDKNVDELKRVKGKALIIACDTATRIMLRHGIETDVIATIDYQPANFFKLRGVDTSSMYLFPALEVTPHILLNHKGKMFNYYHSAMTEKVFEPILGPKGLLRTGGSVLTDAFSIARRLGADPIILVGVDLGFPGMKWYSDGSFDDGQFTKNLKENKVEIVMVPDIHGNPMPTYRSFFEFLKWFNKQISLTEARVIDATEGGARIDGATIMKLSDAIDEYVRDEGDPRALLDEIHATYSPPDAADVARKIREYVGDYDLIRKEIKKGIKSCKRALEIMERSSVLDGNKELICHLKKENMAKQILMDKKMESRLGFISPMMEKQMSEIVYHQLDESLPKREQYRKLVQIDLNFYRKVEKASENMKYHLNNIREELLLEEDHEEFV